MAQVNPSHNTQDYWSGKAQPTAGFMEMEWSTLKFLLLTTRARPQEDLDVFEPTMRWQEPTDMRVCHNWIWSTTEE